MLGWVGSAEFACNAWWVESGLCSVQVIDLHALAGFACMGAWFSFWGFVVYWYACLAVSFYLWQWACTEVLVWCCQELSDLVWLASGVMLAEFVGISAEEAVAQHLACVEDVSPA